MSSLRFVELDDHIYRDIPDDWTIDTIRQKISEDGREPPFDLEDRIHTEAVEEDNTDFTLGGQEFEALPETVDTWADYLPLASEIAAGLATGVKGATQGAEIGYTAGKLLPKPAQAGLTVLGGAAGLAAVAAPATAAGRFSGEVLESLVEGTEFNPTVALEQAWDSAKSTALFTAAFGALGPVAKGGWQAAKNWFAGKPVPDEHIAVVEKLQEKMKAMGATLSPLMVSQTRGSKLITEISNVSEITKQTVKNYFDTYSKYMSGQTEKLISLLPKGSSGEHGKALQKLIEDSDEALSVIVSPIYRTIDVAGRGVNVQARDDAMSLAKEIKNKFRGEPRLDPKTNQMVETVNWPPGSSKVKQAVAWLENVPSKLTFSEAHEQLSTIKKLVRDIKTSSTPDTATLSILNQTENVIRSAMDKAGSKLPNNLKAEYDNVTNYYKQGKNIITDVYLEKAMQVNDPSQIGKMLTQDGFTVGLEQIKKLKELAAEYQTKLAKDSDLYGSMSKQPDVMEGIRRGYLESLLRVEGKGGADSLKILRDKLTQPQFKETFSALFSGTPIPAKIDGLLEELMVLERAVGTDSAFSLSLRSREIGGATSVVSPDGLNSFYRILSSFLPGSLAKKGITAEAIDKQIQLVKAATEMTKRGMPVPKGWLESASKLSGYPTSTLKNMGVVSAQLAPEQEEQRILQRQRQQ